MRIEKEFFFTDFNESEFEEIQELWVQTGMGDSERGDTANTIISCNELGGKLIVMKEITSHEIVGTSWLTYDGRRIFLHHFGIKPVWQRKGLANLLAEETMKFIRSKGTQVKLEVQKDNLIAKRLYENLGFFVFDDYDVYMLRDSSL